MELIRDDRVRALEAEGPVHRLVGHVVGLLFLQHPFAVGLAARQVDAGAADLLLPIGEDIGVGLRGLGATDPGRALLGLVVMAAEIAATRIARKLCGPELRRTGAKGE